MQSFKLDTVVTERNAGEIVQIIGPMTHDDALNLMSKLNDEKGTPFVKFDVMKITFPQNYM